MKEKLYRFMSGRYGVDPLGRFLIISALVLYFISLFTGWSILYLISLGLLIYAYYRMFSRNIYKRSSENQTYMEKTAGIRRAWESKKYLMKQRKTHHIYKCPTCKQKIRIPRGKGRIEIRCPKCNTTFIKNS